MTPPYRLHYAPDNASLIIRLALEEIGAPYETVLIDRAAQGQRAPRYLALNPNGLIPVLETPDGALFETGAILLWLADRHNVMAPPPDDPQRGHFLKWLFFLSNTLHTELRFTFYPEKYTGPDPGPQTALRSTLRSRITGHLTLLDDLAATSPLWFGGPVPSVLDYYLATCLRWMALYPADEPRIGFELARFPNLFTLARTLEHRPAVTAAQSAEGLGPTPFTAPVYAHPPEGTAT